MGAQGNREETGGCRFVRIPEEELLARPDLWTAEGLAEYLGEHGIDSSRPYREDQLAEAGVWLFVQEPATEPAGR